MTSNDQSIFELNVEDPEDDIYKATFRHFKQTHDWSSVIDFAQCDSLAGKVLQLPSPTIASQNVALPKCNTSDHFKPYDEWQMYTLQDGVQGVLVIPGILREECRLDWFRYFHDDLPRREDCDLRANIPLEGETLDNLRWITFGYHHDWDSKVYSLNQCPVLIPDRIDDLCKVVRTYLNVHFEAEAGIVNYYNRKSSLCFHTDHSEINHDAPLLSFSLGSPAIFLIGGLTRNSGTPITPILLRNSDLLIMSGESRLALHAIAKIAPPDMCIGEARSRAKMLPSHKGKIHRINVNVRQVH